MKQPLLFLLLALATYFYFQNSDSPAPAVAKAESRPARPVASQNIVIASVPSYSERWKTGPTAQNDWKTGPTAQNDWKTGPNAQTNFEPFAPNEQANWYQNPGFTIVSGVKIKR